MESSRTPTIGIDLGTTFARVGAFNNGKVEIYFNDEGNRKTQCYVAFTEIERFIGDPARSQASVNPTNTTFDSKRLIGRRFADPAVQREIRKWPFAVVEMVGNPMFKVDFHGQEMLFTPEEITSMVISKVKEIAETCLGGLVHDAVITVPSFFNDSQRQATKDAGAIAGLREVRLLNETTAVALTYGLGKNLTEQRNLLIFDLGGGTLSVAVISVTRGSLFEVKATAGNTHLGGRDFDNKMLEYFTNECKRKCKIDISQNPRAIERMLAACESAKRILSFNTEATVDIEALSENTDFQLKISRARFELLCNDLFSSILGPVQLALNEANLDKNDIHEVVLAGGSTPIPKINKLLRDFFGGKELNKSVDPDEAVAHGAALLAAIIARDTTIMIKDVLLVDVTAMTLGIEANGGAMNCIIKRGTVIPVTASNTMTTSTDNQTEVSLQVFEGERALAADNNLLGRFELSGITPAPKGMAQIYVSFYVDENGILSITAQDKISGKERLPVVTNKARLNAHDISRMILEIDVYRIVEVKQRDRLLLLNKLEGYIYKVKRLLDIHDARVTAEDRTVTKKACEQTLIWLETNRQAKKEDIDQQLQNLKTICKPLMMQLLGPSSSRH